MPGYGKSYGGMGRTTTKKRAKQTAKRAANPDAKYGRKHTAGPKRAAGKATSTAGNRAAATGLRGTGMSERNPPTLRKPTKTKSNPRKPVRR